jgi:hypothetical protein
MRERPATLFLLCLVTVGIAIFCLYAFRAPARRARKPPPMPVVVSQTNSPGMFGYAGSRYILMPGSSIRLAQEPRLFASMAARAGAYLISVRQLYSGNYMRHILHRNGAYGEPLGKIQIVLQTMPLRDTKASYHIDLTSLKAVDDTGRALNAVPSADNTSKPIALPNCAVQMAALEEPDVQSRTLQSLSGTLVETDSNGTTRRIPFTLTNLPLPVGKRMFGKMTPGKIEIAKAKHLPDGLTVILGLEAERLSTQAQPCTEYSALPEQQLVIAPGLPTKIGIPEEQGDSRIVLKVTAAPMGMMQIEMRDREHTWKGKAFDCEPILIVRPKETRGKTRKVVMIRLSRDTSYQRNMPSAPLSFIPPPGQAGGAIMSGVVVQGRPFGEGFTLIKMWRYEEKGVSPPKVLRVPISADGTYTLPNVSPGRYRMERFAKDLIPVLPYDETPGPIEEFLLHRFDAAEGRWTGETVDDIVVRSGQRTTVPPLQWLPSAASRYTTRNEAP